MMKRKGFTLINIAGLATGMAVCLLIILYVQGELSYDQHHERSKDIYRIALERYYPGRSTSYATIQQSIGQAVQSEFPEVKESTRLYYFGQGTNFFVRIGEKLFEEKRVLSADSNMFRVFSADPIAGNLQTALINPFSAVLNETTARKYFGTPEAAIGKTFLTDGNDSAVSFMITAVVKDWPAPAHFHFDILLANSSFPFTREQNYVNFAAHTYLLLQPNANASALESKLPQIVKKYISGEIARHFNQSWEDFQKAGNGYRFFLQPLRDIHLSSNLEGELSPNGSRTAVYVFSLVAIFILILACINFVNLSTARSVERAREVGIRKTFGSERSALIRQFLVESVLIACISLLLAIALIFLFLPAFNHLSGTALSIGNLMHPLRLVWMLAFAIITGLIAGIYPAFVLSSFQPILVLKGKFTSNRFGLLLRNGLVVTQFAISVILIIATLIVNHQMKYMMGDKLGFKKDHLIVVERTDVLGEQVQAFKNELRQVPGVEEVSGTSTMPGIGGFFGVTYQKEGSREQMTGRGMIVDEHFQKTLGLELKEGRFFSREFGTDSLTVVLNERAVLELGLSNPIGTRLRSSDEFFNGRDGTPYVYTVIGVVRDFHFHSLHEPISPLVFNYSKKFGDGAALITARVGSNQFEQTIAKLENTWKQFVKDRPFHYYFLDQSLAQQYQSEITTRKLFSFFSGLAIFIACIGLLGLTAYATQQRIREISIRKILGASSGSIVSMLSKDFLKLILLAICVAFPIAWWMMYQWLQDFYYRVNLSPGIFILAAGAAMAVALLTISFQAVKASLANPVKTLRSE